MRWTMTEVTSPWPIRRSVMSVSSTQVMALRIRSSSKTTAEPQTLPARAQVHPFLQRNYEMPEFRRDFIATKG
jgi:hypothetical protein